jgi:hypothetical protein
MGAANLHGGGVATSAMYIPRAALGARVGSVIPPVGDVQAGLELPEAHHLDRYDDGGASWLPVVLQHAQEAYCLAQEFPCVRA